jgi:alpha-beta hydrolase superfamily lysophospholipase
MRNTESYLEFKKHDVFTQSWLADNESSENLLIVHGLGEHSSSYSHMGEYLSAQGISCHSYDLIGHGQSSGQRGYVSSFEQFVEQLEFIYNYFQSSLKTSGDKKLGIFCHSMGGLITLKTLAEHRLPPTTPIVFSNPLVAIKLEPPKWKLSLAQGLAQLLPRISLDNEIDDNDLTNDTQALAKYSQDPLRHRKITAKLFLELQDTTSAISSQLENVKNPCLFLLSPNDKICDADASQKLLKKFDNAKLELFPQSAHEIVNDLSKNKAFDNLIKFLKGKS